ncbi:ABC transporter permease [Salibaculum griseiflavum]|uniref:Taurine ABC transporter permease n=1 Tax=Salibaculum griseiflavum TaxID=1914409 RepID=A0A2V1P636_9RHOB|nr:ABC transporter permease [Salibaculum griseiflavum]PWG17973.1 taurine ABC transporter permease [Salibaculum griseiflavum]
MELFSDLAGELGNILATLAAAVPFILGYVLLILLLLVVWKAVKRGLTPRRDFGSLKTVTFGDESAVNSNFAASVISVVLIFVLWGAFTGSKLLPGFMHAPGAYTGESSFTYTAMAEDGSTDDATVSVIIHAVGEDVDAPEMPLGDGFAKDDTMVVAAYRSELMRWDDNDEITRDDGAMITAVNGTPIEAGSPVAVDFGEVSLTGRGTLNVTPATGWQMEPIWLPPPEDVWSRLMEISTEGFRNSTLGEHLGYSLFRVIVGFVIGAMVGIPLGYAMGLSDWFRGWFDPIVEFMRPVPPLALIPLVIIWAGIGEEGKIILLFLAALWIMAIGARSGVSGVRISKVHAAYSLGASKWQIMRHVIIPNSLPEIFTAARVAMGVCWGTVVAAELVAAEKGAGMMIMTASKFQNTDIVIMGIILIGVIGFGIDMLMRQAEKWLVPWKGKG